MNSIIWKNIEKGAEKDKRALSSSGISMWIKTVEQAIMFSLQMIREIGKKQRKMSMWSGFKMNTYGGIEFQNPISCWNQVTEYH